ncbi:MAG: hypothetical protein O2854_06845 [Chloroflexi bacterium]|nr:hypothetical protein [Chloroflexota bacterium]
MEESPPRKHNLWFLFGIPIALIAFIIEELFRNPGFKSGAWQIFISLLLGGLSGIALYLIGYWLHGISEDEPNKDGCLYGALIMVLSFVIVILLIIWWVIVPVENPIGGFCPGC